MLISMTGFGEAHQQQGGVAVAVEVRSVNSRYFKLSLRATEGYSALESEIENVVRQRVRRGTLQMNLRVDRPVLPENYRLNNSVLARYREQLEKLHNEWHLPETVPIEALLALPGVVTEVTVGTSAVAADWPLIEATLLQAVNHLMAMREEEGAHLEKDLKTNCQLLESCVAQIEARAPAVVDAFRGRLKERLTRVLEEYSVTLEASDLIKEVSIYADRTDISEEIVRLKSHASQFLAALSNEESAGRKLDFLTQEMFREINTIGSKSSDLEIATQVVECKTIVERMREMIQNIE